VISSHVSSLTRDRLLGFREVTAHGGFSSQDAVDAHFGLAGSVTVDLRITWPGSAGQHYVQDVADVAVGQRIVVEESAPPTSVPPSPAGNGGAGALRVISLVRSLRLQGPSRDGFYRAEWDGRTAEGSTVSSGVYLARVVGPAGGLAARLLVIR
jgi:hypothetical protein